VEGVSRPWSSDSAGFEACIGCSTDREMMALMYLTTYFQQPSNVQITATKTESLPEVARLLSAETKCMPKLLHSPYSALKPKFSPSSLGTVVRFCISADISNGRCPPGIYMADVKQMQFINYMYVLW